MHPTTRVLLAALEAVINEAGIESISVMRHAGEPHAATAAFFPALQAWHEADKRVPDPAAQLPTEPTAPVKLFEHRRAAEVLQAVQWDGSTEAWGAIVDLVDGTPYAVSRRGGLVFIERDMARTFAAGRSDWVCRWAGTTEVLVRGQSAFDVAFTPVTNFASRSPASPGRPLRLPPAAG